MSDKKLTVKRWIRCGELDEKQTEQDDILDDCGQLLDKVYTHEILGEVLFEAEDGKMYTITVEAVIGEANPQFAKDILAEEDDV